MEGEVGKGKRSTFSLKYQDKIGKILIQKDFSSILA